MQENSVPQKDDQSTADMYGSVIDLSKFKDQMADLPDDPAAAAAVILNLIGNVDLPFLKLDDGPVTERINTDLFKEKESKRRNRETEEKRTEPTPIIFLQIDKQGKVTNYHTISGIVKRTVPFFQTCTIGTDMTACFGKNFDEILDNILADPNDFSHSPITGEIVDFQQNKYEFRAWAEGEHRIGLFLGLKLPEARGELARIVEEFQHDIKTELSIIKTNAEFFVNAQRLTGEERQVALDKLPRKMETIVSTANKINTITDFYYSNFFSDRKVHIEEHGRDKVENLVTNYIKPILLNAEDKDDTEPAINADFSEFNVPVWTDLVHFAHIFQNLLSNAVKHRNGKKINIWVRSTNEELILAIKDYGEGIPPEKKERLFVQRFEKRADGSTGLGLMAVQSHLTALNGTCVCDSEVGQGTTFTVRIPNKKKK
jgi:signal transduction histidine kinase